MSLFDIFKRKNKQEVSEMTEDEKQIEEAKRNIAEDGKDSQTEKDRVYESVGEQERRDGDENTQNAKDRVDESEATEKADEEKAEERAEETEEPKKEDGLSEQIVTAINNAVTAAVEKAVGAAVNKAFNEMDRHPQKASDSETEELKKIENIYS